MKTPTADRIITEISAFAPIARMASGSPPAWEMTRSQYARAIRTYYIRLERPNVVAGLLRDHERVMLDQVGDVSQARMRFPLGPRDTDYFGFRIDDPEYPYNRETFIEVEGPDSLRILDWLDYVVAHDLTSRPILKMPAWYPDLVNWYHETGPHPAVDRVEDWSSGLMAHQGHMQQLTTHYAFDRGYDIVLSSTTSGKILTPEKFRIVRLYEHGLTPWQTHCAMVSEAATLGRERVDQEIMHECGLSAHVGLRGGGDPTGAYDAIVVLLPLIDTLEKLNVGLRQRERTTQQDLELDWLTIQAVRKAFLILGRAMMCTTSRRRGLWLTRLARLMPMPDDPERKAPPGSSVPLHLAVLAGYESVGNTAPGPSIAWMRDLAETAMRVLQAPGPLSTEAFDAMDQIRLELEALLGTARWPAGQHFVEDNLVGLLV